MRVNDHLLTLSHAGSGKHHPALAKPDMRHLDRHCEPIVHDKLGAPVEPIGFAGHIVEREMGLSGNLTSVL
jgi:hypothetical protein